jgi:hypothetical protein
MPQVPKIPKLEIRAEGLNTSHPNAGGCCTPGNTYFDSRYISGYTNNGFVMGNWIGRAGWGGQGWAKYHFSARNVLQVGYRQQHVDRDFNEGGSLSDYSVQNDYTWRRDLTVSTMFQYEHWNFPLLATSAQHNLTASFQITYWPRWKLK